MTFKKVIYKYSFLIFTVIFLSACGGVDSVDGVASVNGVGTGLAGNSATDSSLESANNIAPDSIDTSVGERSVKLTGGQRQRFSLTRVLPQDPPNLVLDEAASAVDNEPGALPEEDAISIPEGNEPVKLAPENTAPTISGAPASSIQQGNTYSFTPNAYDQDGDAITFSITNKPSWISFNPATGSLSGTPVSSDIGSYTSIQLTVSDSQATTSLPSFSITVTSAPNERPSISGNPTKTIRDDDSYSFVPSANDPENEVLSFSIQNKPLWASFNTSTGALTGSPGTTNIGITTDIVISVSNGSNSVSLPAFDITVTSSVVTFGSATLSWLPPTENTDGSTLSNLAGYKIYYGTTQDNYPNVVNLDNPGLTSYFLDNLPSGHTYYFAMTAYDSDGNESGYSSTQSKAIP